MNSDQLVFYSEHGISYIRRVKLLQYFKVKTTMDTIFIHRLRYLSYNTVYL